MYYYYDPLIFSRKYRKRFVKKLRKHTTKQAVMYMVLVSVILSFLTTAFITLKDNINLFSTSALQLFLLLIGVFLLFVVFPGWVHHMRILSF
tara:strand:+ start:2214 stop:2489 length:276 start_codon:yes stop_codon:yes gene_type:complete